jgi:hypothetical protein
LRCYVHLSGELVWSPEVVVITEGDPRSTRGLDSAVPRRADSRLDRLAHELDTSVRKPLDDRLGQTGIDRGIVDHNDFHADRLLPNDAPQGSGEQHGTVPGWHDDTDQWLDATQSVRAHRLVTPSTALAVVAAIEFAATMGLAPISLKG